MSATDTSVRRDEPVSSRPVHPEEPVHRLTFARVVRSEGIKLRSVRSTVATFALTALAVAATGILVSALSNGTAMGGDGAVRYDAAGNSLFGTMVAQLVLGVLGALFVTTEFSTGSIRSTLTAVPKRLPVLWAKVAVVGTATLVTLVASLAVAFFVGQALYDGHGPGASLSDPGVLRAVLGAAAFPTAIAVMGVAFGTLLRQTAAAVGVLVGLLFVVPVLIGGLGGVWSDVSAYLPGEAGQAMITLERSPGQLSPLAGLGVVTAWAAGLLALAATTLRRRDA